MEEGVTTMADSYKEKRGYMKRAGGRRLDYIAATKKAGGGAYSGCGVQGNKRRVARSH